MDLAERGTSLSNGLWVRERRKRSERGHQTAILSTDYRTAAAPLAAAMFARWSQENFFKYARQHFQLDRLVDDRTEAISEPLRVVNPDYRRLDGQVRSTNGKLSRRLANFAAMTLEEPIEPKQVELLPPTTPATRPSPGPDSPPARRASRGDRSAPKTAGTPAGLRSSRSAPPPDPPRPPARAEEGGPNIKKPGRCQVLVGVIRVLVGLVCRPGRGSGWHGGESPPPCH